MTASNGWDILEKKKTKKTVPAESWILWISSVLGSHMNFRKQEEKKQIQEFPLKNSRLKINRTQLQIIMVLKMKGTIQTKLSLKCR